jgi:uncharacterized repeat protein (TIGR03803 family)
MRLGSLVFFGLILAGCSHFAGSPSLPGDSSAMGAPALSGDRYGRYNSIYSFSGQASGGAPQAGLVAVNGKLYGTTSSYGNGYGTVFEVSPFGNLTVLHTFGGYPDGAYPAASLMWYKGKLYGTTSAGGTHGGGTVFAITRSGFEQVLHDFGAHGDGAQPEAGLVQYKGFFYGTTQNGGAHDKGTVFELSRSGGEQVIHSFSGGPHDAGHPTSALLVIKNTFYGTTRAGGENKSGGAVYKISPFGQERVLHSFGVAPSDGSNPAGPLVDLDGEMYGTTLHGGNVGRGYGTVFAISTGGNENVIHSFGIGRDGAFPDSGLVAVNGVLYGTTTGGGKSAHNSRYCISSGEGAMRGGYYRCGTIFKVTRFGDEKVMYRFNGYPDGANPEAGLIENAGVLYGTTYWGGSSTYYGTIFAIFP